ncbi:MAG TPA: hypothetical protein VMH32_02830 [Burkholderiales bacterium]|nr:hypothetical protein [Burkholderiales bacterium]
MVRPLWLGWIVLAPPILLTSVAWGAQAAPPCKVMDPELADSYEGPCVKGLAQGKGMARGKAVYEGEFDRGMKDGDGVKSWPWGDRYEGEFKDDFKEGHGVYTWGQGTPWAGEQYDGQFVHDMRQGWGVYTWPNGDKYEGPWEKNQRLGLSPMERSRIQSGHSQEQAFHAGVKVCSLMRPGQPLPELVRGEVDSLDGQVLRVRLTQVPPQVAAFLPRDAKPGAVIADDAVNWAPCN